jgi:acetolactate synthase-1/2/3 large subunit
MFNDLRSDYESSERPLFLIGGGAGDVPMLPVPTVVTWNGLDKVTSDRPEYAGVVGTYGGPGANKAVQNCDLLIAVGTRISGRITGGMPENFAPKAKKYIIDIDKGVLNTLQTPFDVKYQIDAAAFWNNIGLYHMPRHDPWRSQCDEWLKLDPVKPEMLEGDFHHYGFVRKWSEMLPDNAIVVSDTGGNAIMMGHAFKSKAGQRIFSSNGNSAMGFAFCGALGAWFADKSRPIMCLIGDGGFNMNLQEIQTMVNYGANVKTFILNNHCYGNTKLFQRWNYNSRFYACGPDGYCPPDFIRIADAYGVNSTTIDRWEDMWLVPGIIEDKLPWIVDVVHHDFYEYLPRISRFDQPLDEQDA